MRLFVPLFLLLTFLAMISCQTVKDLEAQAKSGQTSEKLREKIPP